MMSPAKRAKSLISVTKSAPPAREAQVVLDLEVADGCVHIVLANCGDAVATEVSVKFSRKLRGLGATVVISDLPLFKQLGVLRPGRELRVLWDAAPAILHGKEAEPFSATVSWGELGGDGRSRRSATFQHDPSIYRVWPERVSGS